MIFNSFQFILAFIPFLICYQIANQEIRKVLILLFGLVLFFLNDRLGLLPLFISILVDFIISYFIQKNLHTHISRVYLLLSWTLNLSLLAFFKYFKGGIFFYNDRTLPMAISFYTFQTLAYTSSVYRGESRREKKFLDFVNFVSFFPQLVMGPIESYQKLMPQLKTLKGIKESRFFLGLQIFLFGVFKKQVIADRIAPFVNKVYDNFSSCDLYLILIATSCFGFQLYCDFSGYMDMGRGIAKVLNVRLTINFRAPFFANSVQDFWARWHISLLVWFKQYIYITIRPYLSRSLAVLSIFILSGAWHGAGLNFILWGFCNGVLVILYQLISPFRNFIRVSVDKFGSLARTFYNCVCVVVTFSFVFSVTVLLRVNSVKDILQWLNNLGDHPIQTPARDFLFSEKFISFFRISFVDFIIFFVSIIFLLCCDYCLFESHKRFTIIRRLVGFPVLPIIFLLLLIMLFSHVNREAFYYFRF